jgi:rhodanese-related sulfurtransferase
MEKKMANKKHFRKYFFIILSISILFTFIAAFCGCSCPLQKTAPAIEIEEGKVNNISIDKAYELIKGNDGTYFILDVRSPEEYKESHIEGSVLIPVNELEGRLAEVPKDKVIIVYCRSGNRSLTASNILVENGFNAVINVEGGITAWIDKGYPVVSG